MDFLLNQLIYTNFIEAMREFARWQRSSQLSERDGILFVAGSTTFPMFMNYVIRLDRSIPATKVIEQAKVFFQVLKRDFTLFIFGEQDRDLEAAARAAGMKQLLDAPAMVTETPLEPPVLAANVEIRQVTEEQELLEVRRINNEAYETIEFPKEQTEAIFGVLHRLLAPNLIVYVAYLDGQPASTAMAIMSEQVAGINWVGTIPAARGRGLAEACTRIVTNAGFARGAKIAALLASPMGEPIYQRLGYRTIDRVKCYMTSLADW